MTNTMQITDKKVTKAVDAARENGWETTIEGGEAEQYARLTAIHPAPVEGFIAVVMMRWDFMDDKWLVDYATYQKASRDGSRYREETCSHKDAMRYLTSQASPKAQATKALADAERAAKREQAAQDYAAQPDSASRRSLRSALTRASEAHADRDKYDAEAERSLTYAIHWYLGEALAEAEYCRLAAMALSWEGGVDEKGVVTSLEEAVARVADTALTSVLSTVKRGASRSSNTMANLEEDMGHAGAARFIAEFHPIYSGRSFLARRGPDEVPVNLDWLGKGHI